MFPRITAQTKVVPEKSVSIDISGGFNMKGECKKWSIHHIVTSQNFSFQSRDNVPDGSADIRSEISVFE